MTGLYTGQRLKDIASLTWANVDLEQEEIKFSTSKTGRFQAIPINKHLLHFFEELPGSDNPLAPIFSEAYRVATEHLHTGILSRHFGELLVAAGLTPAGPETHAGTGKGRQAKRVNNPLSFHSLRHTATSLLKNAGVSDAVAMDIIGHESTAVSASYTHIDDNAKRKALNKLPDITAE